jgi:hypothetical protein
MPYRAHGFGPDRSRYPHEGGDHRHHHHRMIYWNGGIYPYSYFYPGPIFTGYVDPWLFGPEMYGYGDSSDYGGYPDYDGSAGYAGSGYDGPGYSGDVPSPYRNYGAQPYGPQEYQGQSAMPQNPSDRMSYTPQSEASARSASPRRQDAVPGHDTVTVIFKDGRPPEQIQNYLLTSTTLTVLDAHYRQIPLDQINVAATEQANRAAGIDFRVPASRHE